MKLKEFIKQFSFKKPNWDNLPEGFPECDLDGLTSAEIGKFMAIKNPALRRVPKTDQSLKQIFCLLSRVKSKC